MELSTYLKMFTKVTLVFLTLCLLGWMFIPDYRPYVAGWMLGSFVSALNVRYLGLKIQRLSEMIAQSTGKRYSLGFVSRISMVLIAVMLAIRFDLFHLPATVAGLFYGPVAVYILGLIALLRQRN